MYKRFAMLFTFLCVNASAGLLPYGIKIDVQASTVVDDWGWTQCYSTTGNSTGIAFTTVLSGCNGDSLMMAIRQSGSDMFDILGAARFDTVTQFTALSRNTQSYTGNDENGISWYFNHASWGFTQQGNTVNQFSADTNLYYQGWNGQNDAPFNHIGLSYHTNSIGLRGGWAFNNGDWTALNSGYERVWLTTDATAVELQTISEPITALLVISGIFVMGGRGKRVNPSAAAKV